jgi:ATP-dependent exoDNAse (exonuclease V) alpha subunit
MHRAPRQHGGEKPDNRCWLAEIVTTWFPQCRRSVDSRISVVMSAANNISLPEPLLAEIQSAAQAEHRSVDDVLTDAVKRYVEEHSWTNLLNYGAERAKALGIKESDVDRLIAESRAEQRSHWV